MLTVMMVTVMVVMEESPRRPGELSPRLAQSRGHQDNISKGKVKQITLLDVRIHPGEVSRSAGECGLS